MPGAEPLELRAADGVRIGATLFRPAAPNGRAVQINSAAGVRQEYYARLAGYLAERGFTVLTFDYRGTGRSALSSLRNSRTTLREWAKLDAAVPLSFFEKENLKPLALGHSFGGASLGLVSGAERFAAALAVGSQSCYWGHWEGAWRGGMWLLTRALVPAATQLFGYFPGSLLGQGENLPAGVALDWARACGAQRYLSEGAEEHYDRFAAPLRLYSISDDLYAPPKAVQALAMLYPNAAFEVRRLAPEELGVDSIGHFGFFRERFRDSLWREAADWLETHG